MSNNTLPNYQGQQLSKHLENFRASWAVKKATSKCNVAPYHRPKIDKACWVKTMEILMMSERQLLVIYQYKFINCYCKL